MEFSQNAELPCYLCQDPCNPGDDLRNHLICAHGVPLQDLPHYVGLTREQHLLGKINGTDITAEEGREDADITAEKESDDTDITAEKESEDIDITAGEEREDTDLTAGEEREDTDITAEKEREDTDITAGEEREDTDITAGEEKEDTDITAGEEREDTDITAEKESENTDITAGEEREDTDITAEKEREDTDITAEKECEDTDITAKEETEDAELSDDFIEFLDTKAKDLVQQMFSNMNLILQTNCTDWSDEDCEQTPETDGSFGDIPQSLEKIKKTINNMEFPDSIVDYLKEEFEAVYNKTGRSLDHPLDSTHNSQFSPVNESKPLVTDELVAKSVHAETSDLADSRPTGKTITTFFCPKELAGCSFTLDKETMKDKKIPYNHLTIAHKLTEADIRAQMKTGRLKFRKQKIK